VIRTLVVSAQGIAIGAGGRRAGVAAGHCEGVSGA
jgi:hypothetical protein